MPKSRIQLIKEIKQARKDAKANLLYVKGLTKMKKKELNEIYNEIKQVDNRTSNYDSDGELSEQELVNTERKEDLEKERERIKDELAKLELEEEEIKEEEVVLDELEEEQEEQEEEQKEESEEEYIEDIQNPAQELDELESDNELESEEESEEEEEPVKKTKKTKKEKTLTLTHFKKEIKDMTLEFEESIHEMLLEFNEKEKLTDTDISDITNFYNETREIMEDNLKSIYREMPDGIDFTPTFYNSIERVLDKQEDKVNKFVSM
jgi:chromosome segregation ATPase